MQYLFIYSSADHHHHDYKTPVDALAGIMVHDMEHHVKEMMEMKKAMKAKMGDDMMMAMGKEMEKHKDNIKMMVSDMERCKII